VPPGPIAASPEPHPGYRPCVGIVLLDPAARIFLGRRPGALPKPWQMPQGGIDPGEQPAFAALRELHEETGVRAVRPLFESRSWYAYDLPDGVSKYEWHGRWRGQTQRWLAFAFEGRDDDIRLDGHHVEFVDWRWARPAEVLDLVVEFKRPVYEQVLAEFEHLLGRPASG
jgi:putative (di)nucleoside polyphosphate hydrolase